VDKLLVNIAHQELIVNMRCKQIGGSLNRRT
jgi:hypothetical protein